MNAIKPDQNGKAASTVVDPEQTLNLFINHLIGPNKSVTKCKIALLNSIMKRKKSN